MSQGLFQFEKARPVSVCSIWYTCTIILLITRIVKLHIHVQSFIAWLQSRYVGYYERVKKDLGGHLPPETKKRITSVKIEGLEGQYKYFGL